MTVIHECSECHAQFHGLVTGDVCPACLAPVQRYTVHPHADDLLATPPLTASERATDRLMRKNRGVEL